MSGSVYQKMVWLTRFSPRHRSTAQRQWGRQPGRSRASSAMPAPSMSRVAASATRWIKRRFSLVPLAYLVTQISDSLRSVVLGLSVKDVEIVQTPRLLLQAAPP